MPTKWLDGTNLDFTAFLDGYPISNAEKTNLIMNDNANEFGMWKNAKGDNPDYKRNCFCQRVAIAGNPEPPPYPELPINEFCEQNWLFMPSSGNCIYHDISVRAWKSAQQNCNALGVCQFPDRYSHRSRSRSAHSWTRLLPLV